MKTAAWTAICVAMVLVIVGCAKPEADVPPAESPDDSTVETDATSGGEEPAVPAATVSEEPSEKAAAPTGPSGEPAAMSEPAQPVEELSLPDEPVEEPTVSEKPTEEEDGPSVLSAVGKALLKGAAKSDQPD